MLQELTGVTKQEVDKVIGAQGCCRSLLGKQGTDKVMGDAFRILWEDTHKNKCFFFKWSNH